MTIALSLLVALLAIASPVSAETVRFGATPSFSFLAIYAADQLGYFKAEGITPQFADFEGGAEVTTAMVGGSIDMAATYVERPLILADKGFGAKNLLAFYNKNALHLVVRKELPATDLKGLKGKKLGMTRAGSATDLALRALIRDAGLEPDRDIAVIAVGGVTSATAALKSGQVDGAIGAEPMGSITVNQLKLARFFIDARKSDAPKFFQYMTFPTLQASDRYIQAHRDTVERVVRAVAKTQKRMREDPEAAVQAARKIFPHLDVALIRSVILADKHLFAPTITEEAMRFVNQFQKQSGVVKGDYPYEKVVAVQFKQAWDQ